SLSYVERDPRLLSAYKLREKKLHPEAKPTDRPGEAMQYEILLRSETGKSFSYQPDWKMKAQKAARRLPIAKFAGDNMVWVERGPGNIGGRTRSIAVHPEDHDIWWIAAVGGGIWKTIDAGMSWNCQTDDLPVISATTIAICKSEPEILYAGTGEGFYNYDAIVGNGIFKTVNGGTAWQQLASTAANVNFRYVNRIIVNPDNPQIVLAATNSGLCRSENGGADWTIVFEDSGRVQQIIANPLNFYTQYLTIYARGIYKSTDMGLTWRKSGEEITEGHQRIEIAISEADTNYLYAAAERAGNLSGFFKSVDAGKSWNRLGSYPNYLGGQGWYDNALCVDPYDPDVVIAGGIDLLKINTVNDILKPEAISNWYGGNGLPYVHADQHFIVTIEDTSASYAILAANDGGIFYSPDSGVTWQNKNNNYNVTQYYDGDRHPFRDQFIAGSQDNGTNLSSSDAIYSDRWTDVIGGDGFDCAWDKEDPNIIYGTIYDSKIYKSENGGGSFRLLNGSDLPPSNFFHTPLEMDPHNSQKLFTASETDMIYYSYNGGEDWNRTGVKLGAQKFIKIRISRADSSIVWAASTSDYINVSTNAGVLFKEITNPDGVPKARLTGMETHPDNPACALITFGISGYGKIFRTTDLGSSWEDITHNLPDVPVHCALIMPYNTNEIWIGTDIGIFISTNNGQSWSYAGNGLPAVSVRRLKIVNQEIIAVTHGRGIWSLHNDLLPERVIPLDIPLLADPGYPDPNTNQLRVNFMARGVYDLILVQLNNEAVKQINQFPVYEDTSVYIQVQAPDVLDLSVAGVKNGVIYQSETKTINYREKINLLDENFNQTSDTLRGDMQISQESGFIETPIQLFSDSKLVYDDVAIVEPGEPGEYYPSEMMWDYVAVEGSANGSDWQLLTEPYDCRYDSVWQAAFLSSADGDSTMFRNHEIQLTDFYSPGKIIYIRFRLHADAASNGWGWAIDNIKISGNLMEGPGPYPKEVNRFELIGNYPNPFNSTTTIKFIIAADGPVRLDVFNILGQKVRTIINNKTFTADQIHQVQWNGILENGNQAASGTYYYRLLSDGQSKVKKMVLLR
ncbi:MAG: T9SS type A sorting domain-containing protein, partial [Calditrichaceae bacterium]